MPLDDTMKPFSTALLFTIVSCVLVSSSSSVQGVVVPQEDTKESEPRCACSKLWAPVCGTDGNTYENEGCLRVRTTKCGTIKSLVSDSYEGECKQANAAATGKRLCSSVFFYAFYAILVVNVFRNQ